MQFEERLLAYCGLYCPQCSIRTSYDTGNRAHVQSMPERYNFLKEWPLEEYRCECCKGDSACGPCKMRDCAGEKGFVSCADCEQFPCEENIVFENDDSPHHTWAIENLRIIKEVGYMNWFESMKDKLSCDCGKRLSWYYACPDCGKRE